MSAPPYIKLYIADYTADVQHLTCEQDGAYWRLLRAMWRAGGKLPYKQDKLATICGLAPKRWQEIGPDVLALFQVRGGQLRHKRLSAELAKCEAISEVRKEASSAGVAEKRRKNSDRIKPNGSPNGRITRTRTIESPLIPQGGDDVPIEWVDRPDVVDAFREGGVLRWLQHFQWQDVPRRQLVTTNAMAFTMVQRSAGMQFLWALGLDIEKVAA